MKRRLNLWMLLALVAGFALVFAGLAAASRSSSRYFWFGALFGSILSLLLSLPVLVLPWIWNRWARRRGIEMGQRELTMSGIVVLVAILILAALLYLLNDRGWLEWFLDRSGLLDWIVG